MPEEIIHVTKTNAIKAFNKANPETQETLKSLFEGQVNFVKTWKDVTCFEDACQIVGEDPNNPRFNTSDEDDNINRRMKVVMKAYNGNWKPNWSDDSQRKYYIVWQYSGAGFRLGGVSADFSYSSVGSRLSFETYEKAIHAANNMTSFFNQYLIQ